MPLSLGLVLLALAFEPGGLPCPMATAAFDELLRGILVTLYLTPVLYTLSGAWDKQVEASEGDADSLGQTAPPRTA